MKNNHPLLILLFVFTAHVSISAQVHSQNKFKNISIIQSDSLIKANSVNPNFVILDVRRASEWSSNHLQGSICRNYYDSDFRQQIDKLPKHKTFLIHCQSGGRSAKAFAVMQELGFAEVYNMNGGISTWQNNSFPVTKEVTPLLMLVSHEGITGNLADTVNVTITNRANDQLAFNSVFIDDTHAIEHNFDHDIIIQGAEDYTFSIYHSPGYATEDSTSILLESNGGNLELKVKVSKDVSTSVQDLSVLDFEIYPNPTSNKLHLKGFGSKRIQEISVYTISGKCILRKFNHPANTSLSLAHLKPGVHVMRIKQDGFILTKKLLIKR